MRASTQCSRSPSPKLNFQARNWRSFTIQATGSALVLAIGAHMSSNSGLQKSDLRWGEPSTRHRSASPEGTAQRPRPGRTSTGIAASPNRAQEEVNPSAFQQYSRPAWSPRRPQLETTQSQTWKPLPDTPRSAPPVSASLDRFPIGFPLASSQSPASSRYLVSPMSQLGGPLSLTASTFNDEADISLFAQALSGLGGMEGMATGSSGDSTPNRQGNHTPRVAESLSPLSADAEAEAGLAAMREAEARERMALTPSPYHAQPVYVQAPNLLREYYNPDPPLLHVPRLNPPGGPRPLSAPIYQSAGVAQRSSSSQGFAEALHSIGPESDPLAEHSDGDDDQFGPGPSDELPDYAQSQKEAAERARKAALRRAAELEQRWAASRSHRK